MLFLLLSFRIAYPFEKVDFLNEINAGLQKPADIALSPDGIIFGLDERGCKVYLYDASGYLNTEFGGCGSGEGLFRRPASLAYTPQGYVLVADTGNHRVQAFDENGRFQFAFGRSGRLRGEFNRPSGIAVDVLGNIYVADTYNNRVQLFSPHGVYRDEIKLNSRPADVAVDNRNALYILLPEEGIVQVHDQGRVDPIRCVVGGKDFLKNASAVAVDHRGDIYITESGEHSVKKFDKSETILLTFGSEGGGRGQFDGPRGIVTDTAGHVYIADQDNGRLQIFEVTGSGKPETGAGVAYPSWVDYADKIRAQDKIDDVRVGSDGTVYAVSARHNNLLIIGADKTLIGKTGRGDGEFNSPAALDVGPEGYIYVADTGNNRVQVFDKAGNFVFAFGERGRKAGQLTSPAGVAVNDGDMLYVADTGNHRIQIYNKDGIFLKAFGELSRNGRDESPASGTFRSPTGLAVDSRGLLYVVDRGNHRIQIFDPHGQFIKSFGVLGDEYLAFNLPSDIALTDDDVMVIADAGNHRVQIVQLSLDKTPFMFGAAAQGPGEFESLTGVDVTGQRIYAADTARGEIRVYEIFDGKTQPKVKAEEPAQESPLKVEPDTDEEFELK